MSAVPNLDDPNQTVFYIPFAGDRNKKFDDLLSQSIYWDRDIPDGEQRRINAYKVAWGKCLERVQSIIHALHAPVAAEIVNDILTSYKSPLPGLPYPELPVISIANSIIGSSFFNQITPLIDTSNIEVEDLFETIAFTAHIYPDDCVNLITAMKCIIGGFVDRPQILDKVKKRPTMSLANYDVETLLAWYAAVRDTYDIKEKHQPTLIVLLHDFEQLNTFVVQDIFGIFSVYVSRLPLVFVLALSSPSSSSYLQSFYPRSTLALLRVHDYTIPSGPQILEEIVFKTFFSVEFQPSIMIGPAALEFLVDFYNRHNSSLDATLTILQLIHMKHFSVEPLTLLVESTPSPALLSEQTSFPFVDSLFSRVQLALRDASSSQKDNSDDTDWSRQSLSLLITAVDDARTFFQERVKRIRIGFSILDFVQTFMEKQGYKGLKGHGRSTLLDVATDIIRGRSASTVMLFGNMIRKLTSVQLKDLFEDLKGLLNQLSISGLPEPLDAENDTSVNISKAHDFVEWLTGHLNDNFAPLEEANLWDIWYTGQTPFPADLLNPSLRASVTAGLLRPRDFAERGASNEKTDLALSELPDTSILFHGYLDSGRMINLYDWFESFQLEIERQRKALKKGATKNRRKSTSPTKYGTRKGKERAEQVTQSVGDDEEDSDEWRVEVQARFMRALQELDYLGFLKHTGRKADHVQRTVFDMHD